MINVVLDVVLDVVIDVVIDVVTDVVMVCCYSVRGVIVQGVWVIGVCS